MPESEFKSRADALFKPLGLASVVGAVIDILSAATTKFGYFYNPHVVYTRLLDDSSCEMERLGKQLAAWASSSREAAFPGRTCRSVSEECEALSGVPTGKSEHREIYFEPSSTNVLFPLHQEGISFRVRLTKQSDVSKGESLRVLLILTQFPIRTYNCRFDPLESWGDIDVKRFPVFSSLEPLFDRLADSSALPSVVDCFVAYLNPEHDAAELFKKIESIELDGVRRIAYFEKKSLKFDLLKWNQNPLSGAMEPDWAYVALDQVQVNGNPNAGSSQSLTQIELEVGPSIPVVTQSMKWISEIDFLLRRMNNAYAEKFGRKIHRVLTNNLLPRSTD